MSKTAVILTGGIGTRMAPITHSLNKSLVPIDGKPALAKLVSQLDLSNIQKIIILTGYLSWQVEETIEHLSNSISSELNVIKSHPDFSPAQRLLCAQDRWTLSEELILIYCDNLIDDSIIIKYLLEANTNRVLVQKRSRGNVSRDELETIKYFAERASHLDYVELGYWRLKPQEFLSTLKGTLDLPAALERYTSKFSVSAQEVNDYTSVSDIERYAKQRDHSRLTMFLDRDGVLVKSVGKGEYLRKESEVYFLERNIEMLQSLSIKYDIDYIVVTNQAGIERKIVTAKEVENINQFIALKMLNAGVPIIAFYVCPHHWDSNCDCRKPGTGMLRKAFEDFALDGEECLLIGDQESDIQAGTSAGVRSFLIQESFSNLEHTRVRVHIESALEELKLLH